MAKYDHLTELLGLPNVQVTHYQLVGPNRLNLFIESTVAAGLCPTCQQLSLAVHDYGEPQLIRDLPIWNRRCWLRYSPRRFECASCEKTFVERVAWREPGLEYTDWSIRPAMSSSSMSKSVGNRSPKSPATNA